QTLNYRIREGEVQKVPYMGVIGQREADADTIAVRVRGAGTKQEILPVAEFLERVREQVRQRELVP
ncbi:MAG TPA: His/Gly/Thr/Pro-type tRNA ligase C-terminal domain-containing protein, partial [Gemmatimonadales bacterium]|nr:His/Gly/Thr/Pro-type tRNA ligase C-terminal domain-containing protein [Gemmatimonadales bacterium]